MTAPALQTLCDMLNVATGSSHNVEDFEKTYIVMCGLRAATAGSPSEDLLRRARIHMVQLRKTPHGSQHEYILVYIILDGQAKESGVANLGIIKCERLVKIPLSRDKAPRLRDLSFFPGAIISKSANFASSSFSSSSSSTTLPAVDRFTIYDPQGLPQDLQGDQVVYEYIYPTQRAPLPTCLLSAACVLHVHSPDYILLDRQCFWFAGMIFRMIVGADTDNLYATLGAARREVRFAIAYQHASGSNRTGAAQSAKGDPIGVSRGKVKVSIGTKFQTAFNLVTANDIEKCYRDVAGDFEARRTRIDAQVAEGRAQAMKRGQEDIADEKESLFTAMSKEEDELVVPVLVRTNPVSSKALRPIIVVRISVQCHDTLLIHIFCSFTLTVTQRYTPSAPSSPFGSWQLVQARIG